MTIIKFKGEIETNYEVIFKKELDKVLRKYAKGRRISDKEYALVISTKNEKYK